MACHIAPSPYMEGGDPCETRCEFSSMGEVQVA